MKLSTHKSLSEAKKAAERARETHVSVIVSSQPGGYTVYAGKEKK